MLTATEIHFAVVVLPAEPPVPLSVEVDGTVPAPLDVKPSLGFSGRVVVVLPLAEVLTSCV